MYLSKDEKILKGEDEENTSKALEILLADTCLAVAPLKSKFKTIVTNSAEAFYYSRGMNRFQVKVASLDKCIQVALKRR